MPKKQNRKGKKEKKVRIVVDGEKDAETSGGACNPEVRVSSFSLPLFLMTVAISWS